MQDPSHFPRPRAAWPDGSDSPCGEDVPSPCVGICRLDADGRQCLGCRRTLEEISRWSIMTARERRAVLAELAVREERGASTEGKTK